MLERRILMGIILYSFLYTIPKTFPVGKMGRKNIMKALKKQLKIYDVKKGHQEYLKLIELAETVMSNTKVVFSGEELEMLNPGALFAILEKNYPEYLELFEIKQSWLNNIKESYIGTGNNTFVSVKYTNKLINEIEENCKG
jgi:hypothetical protein